MDNGKVLKKRFFDENDPVLDKAGMISHSLPFSQYHTFLVGLVRMYLGPNSINKSQ